MNKLYCKDLNCKDCKIILFICIFSYFISKNNYVLFHTFVEIITVTISFSIMLIALGTIKICDNYYFSYLGISYGFIGLIDMFHTFTYKGIDIITSNSNVPTQLWIAGRYYESLVLIFSFWYLKKNINFKRIIIVNFAVISIILVCIFRIKMFPECYVEGYGLTKFKIYSEYIICLIFLSFIFLKNMHSEFRQEKEYKILILSVIFKILSEISFVLYIGVYDFSNFVGHIMKFISFYFLYKALFKSVIINPYSSIFQNLNSKAKELEDKNEELLLTKVKIEKDYLKYRELIEFLPEGILITEGNRISYANNKLCLMLNLKDRSGIIGRRICEILDYSYYDKLKENLRIQSKKKLINPEEYKFCFNGTNLDVEISTLFMRNEEENKYSISIIRDISDRKKVEEMEVLLLEKEKEENFKNEFFANISHELRTPINVIYSAIQLESIYLDKRDINTIIRYNSIVKQNCLRLIRITNNIIDTTKIQAGFFKPTLKEQDIVNIVEEITLSIRTYSNYKNINIIFDTEYEEIYANCDENLIERIMLNLLSNSIKYGKQDGNIEVNIYKKRDSTVQISIKDDGIGIPESLQNKIFERFEKVDKSMSRCAEGSGIGLYLVKSFVEMQKGSISIKSEIDKWTEILITLPIVQVVSEICATTTECETTTKNNIIEKIDIEFSDIYK